MFFFKNFLIIATFMAQNIGKITFICTISENNYTELEWFKLKDKNIPK